MGPFPSENMQWEYTEVCQACVGLARYLLRAAPTGRESDVITGMDAACNERLYEDYFDDFDGETLAQYCKIVRDTSEEEIETYMKRDVPRKKAKSNFYDAGDLVIELCVDKLTACKQSNTQKAARMANKWDYDKMGDPHEFLLFYFEKNKEMEKQFKQNREQWNTLMLDPFKAYDIAKTIGGYQQYLEVKRDMKIDITEPVPLEEVCEGRIVNDEWFKKQTNNDPLGFAERLEKGEYEAWKILADNESEKRKLFRAKAIPLTRFWYTDAIQFRTYYMMRWYRTCLYELEQLPEKMKMTEEERDEIYDQFDKQLSWLERRAPFLSRESMAKEAEENDGELSEESKEKKQQMEGEKLKQVSQIHPTQRPSSTNRNEL